MSTCSKISDAEEKVTECVIRFEKVRSNAPLESVTQVFAEQNQPCIFGGNGQEGADNRFSFWTCDAIESFEFQANEIAPFDKLDNVLAKYTIKNRPEGLPGGIFVGGWVGFFSYELGRFIEKIPETAVDDLGLPLIKLNFYDKVLCFDSKDKVWYLTALAYEGASQSSTERIEQLKKLLITAEETSVELPRKFDLENIGVENLRSNISKEYYFESLKKTQQYIYDGQVYQINFSQRFNCDYDGQPIRLYHWQNRYNPSPWAVYFDCDEYSIVSASPEMFITIQNGVISTKPIKGTRPRTAGANSKQINQRNIAELTSSEKEKAELNMIIDLERNDLTRICRYGSIRVAQQRKVEPYPTVYHAAAVVEGQLREGLGTETMGQILRAVFPGGSITGAPKVKAMEIIDELEPTCRSVYTGSIGFIGVDGCCKLNIAIRTIIVKEGKAYCQSGGGIVADSNPQAEWDETITKARALIAAIRALS